MNFLMLALFFISKLLLQPVLADVEISSPSAGDTFSVSGSQVTIDLVWDDDGESPSLDNVQSYVLVLCTGPNDDITPIDEAVTLSPSDVTDYKYSLDIDADAGADGNYYVQIYTTFKTGGYTTHYTPRFKLSDMTGSTKASGSGDPPNSENSASADTSAASASFTVAYTLQTGKTRYAPMQMQPGSTVTVSTWSRRFATSSVSYYSTLMASPNVYSTVTPGWSYTMSSQINYATPAPFPSELSWYPASQRLVSASLDSNERRLKKRRWDD